MPYTYTRTHVHYFNEEQLVDLDRAITALEHDFEERAPHMSDETREAGRTRLRVATAAWHLMAEPVAEAL